MRSQVALRLIEARKERHLSQDALADEINAGQTTVATWERGVNEPDLATFQRLSKVLNRSPAWLAFGIKDGLTADLVSVAELDIRAHSGAGGMIEMSEGDEDAVVARYAFPRAHFKATFGAEPDGINIFEIVGDSMLGTLMPGEKVFVNRNDRMPSPPGIFVVWDGLGLVLKRVSFVPHSDPPRVKIISDNPRYEPYERNLDEAYIQGRVIGSWQRR